MKFKINNSCPYCGSNNVNIFINSINNSFHIYGNCYCEDCGSCGPKITQEINDTHTLDTIQNMIIEAWNKRPTCKYTYDKERHKYISSCGYNLGLNNSWIYCPNCGKELITDNDDER